MASTFPWYGFSSIKLKRSESPIPQTDRGWVLAPTVARSKPYGSTKDDIAVLSVGSMTREFEAIFEIDRFNSLRALINTTGVFTDTDRPTPTQQNAFLLNVEPLDRTLSTECADSNGSHQRVRAKVTLLSQ